MARLGAFFAAVVLIGNVLLHSLRSAVAAPPLDPAENGGGVPRKKRRLERKVLYFLEWVISTPASAMSTAQDGAGAKFSSPIAGGTATTANLSPPSKPAESDRFGVLPPPTTPFAWPAPLEAPRPSEVILPTSMGFSEWSDFRAELVTDLHRRCGRDRLGDIGDAMLIWPELLFDGVSSVMSSTSGRGTVRTWEDDDNRSVTGRLLDVQYALRDQRISSVFLRQLNEREQKYFGAFEESRANSFGFEDRSEGVDLSELGRDQRNVLLDALRRTYLARYKMKSDENIPEEAWALGRWTGLDFAVLPPLIGGLIYYRGLNKRFSMGDTALRVAFEPLSDLMRRGHDRSVAAALEWTFKGFPVGIIVSAGRHDGRYEMDFVGIGTSIGAVRRAVENQSQDVRRPSAGN